MMQSVGVRLRIMLVAVIPLLVLAIVLTVLYTSLRLNDQEQGLQDRGRAFSRQLAAASEYAVFSGNHESLQQLANSVLGEADVVGVSIVNSNGDMLVHSGRQPPALPDRLPESGMTTLGSVLRIFEPVRSQALALDDMPAIPSPPAATPTVSGRLGIVMVDLSTDRLAARRQELLYTGLGTTMWALLATLVLAGYMGQGVSATIRRVADTAEKIGQGQLHERLPPRGGGSLRRLATGVNEMADRLAESQALMMQRIEEATAELRQRKEEAELANLAKSRFLAVASHDLRQPMHALSLFICELDKQRLNPRSRWLVQQIESSAAALDDLLESLLDISRLDAGALKPNMSAFALQPVLARIIAGHIACAAESGLHLQLRPTECWVHSDPVLLERILSNLISNAIRYTPSGCVLIACRRRGEQLRIEVRDSGIGIPAEKQELIFQEFTRLGNKEHARDKGLGLGLAIVRRLSALLDHRIDLISAAGRGSVFAITLPLAAEQAYAEARSEFRLPGDLHGTRVALVDDDALARNGLESLLRTWNCDIRAAASQEELLQLLADDDWQPDLLISDFRLSGPLNGVELIELVRNAVTPPGLPAILISGDTAAETLALAGKADIPMLHKPVRPARLRTLINRSLISLPDAGSES